MRVRAGLVAGLAATALAVSAPTALAAFSLQVLSNPSFSVALGGVDQSAAYTVPLRVTQTDTGANGNAGWNLTMTSTRFTSGAFSLPTNATSITGVAASCAGGTCTNPANSVAYPVGLPAGSPAPTAVKVFNAATGTGKGTFDVTPGLTTAVLANQESGTYTSTVTVSLVRGP
jgi:hypothetical protein